MGQTDDQSKYIEDTAVHNGWWRGETRDLERVVDLPFRSDYFKLLLTFSYWQESDCQRALLPYFGQKGIGKTTLFKQAIGTLLDGPPTDVTVRDEKVAELVGTVPPSQILYVPVERSLYELEDPDKARAELQNVVRYFRSHVANQQQQKYVIIDDLGALDIEGDPREGLIDILDDRMYLVVASDLRSEVDFDSHVDEHSITYDRRHYPISLLPIKFVDYVRMSCEQSRNNDHRELAREIGAAKSYRVEHPKDEYDSSPIGEARSALASGNLEKMVEALDTLYFGFLNNDDRTLLGNLCRAYIRDGGLLYQPHSHGPGERIDGDRWAASNSTNELIRSKLQLTLFKSIAPHYNIKQPRNLLRLAALAARTSPPEYEFTTIADLFGVDRRTVDRYLDALGSATLLTQSRQFDLRRHRRARLYLGDPRYLILLSQRANHTGFESFASQNDILSANIGGETRTQHVGNPVFERALALTAGFDHIHRLSYRIRSDTYRDTDAPVQKVEYLTTDEGPIDYIVRDAERVYPFVLDYQPQTGYAEDVLTAFDPTVGSHEHTEHLDQEYEAPYRFIVTDDYRSEGTDTLLEEHDGFNFVRIPYWLFLLIC